MSAVADETEVQKSIDRAWIFAREGMLRATEWVYEHRDVLGDFRITLHPRSAPGVRVSLWLCPKGSEKHAIINKLFGGRQVTKTTHTDGRMDEYSFIDHELQIKFEWSTIDLGPRQEMKVEEVVLPSS